MTADSAETRRNAMNIAWAWIREAAQGGPPGMLPVVDGMLHGILWPHDLLDHNGDAAFADAQERGVAIGRLASAAMRDVRKYDVVDRLAWDANTVRAYAPLYDGQATPAYDAALSQLNQTLAACIGNREPPGPNRTAA